MSEYLTATSRVLDLLRSTFGANFKEYFDGVPNEDIPEAAFPCVIVHKLDGTVSLGATGQDILRSRINIHFLTNQADDVNASGSKDVTQHKLQDLIEGRDENGQWRPGTAMHILRTQISLGGTTLELNTDFQYDLTPRDDLPTITEAVIQVITRETVSVPERN